MDQVFWAQENGVGLSFGGLGNQYWINVDVTKTVGFRKYVQWVKKVSVHRGSMITVIIRSTADVLDGLVCLGIGLQNTDTQAYQPLPDPNR